MLRDEDPPALGPRSDVPTELEPAAAPDHTAARALPPPREAAALEARCSYLQHLLRTAEAKVLRLQAALSDERRTSMRLLQEAEDARARLEEQLLELQERTSGTPSEQPPRHSLVVRREGSVDRTAETLPPPPMTRKGGT